MIQKDKDDCSTSSTFSTSTDPRMIAGEKAEKQMAHYLKRAFGNEEWVWVFNDLRFPIGDQDAVQIDHLVLYKYGIIIIESKSVTTEVRINEDRQWQRKFYGWKGMASPIKQAERQTSALRHMLRNNAESLVGKMLFGKLQKGLKFFSMRNLVAISDDGIISGSGRKLVNSQLKKADQICDEISKIMKARKKAEGFFSVGPTDEVGTLTEEEMINIGNYFLASHTPKIPVERLAEVGLTESPEPLPSMPSPVASEESEASICPRCESALILRTAKKGENAGAQFWGCSTFPKCRFTKAL